MRQNPEDESASSIAALARAVIAAPAPEAKAIRQAKLLLLDTIGCGIAGARDPVAQAVFATCVTGGSCVLMGRAAMASVLDAVLINGAALRVLDLNDYLVNIVKGEPETGGHPSDNIPVALAVGAERKRSGAEILAAIVTGYDIYARLQRLMDRGGVWDGATVSGLVTPAIASLLMGLDEIHLAHALALGLSRAATPSIVRRGAISAAKSITNALIAQSGVRAALLAEQNITGPLAILDDAHGLRSLFTNDDPALLAAPFPAGEAILRSHVKAYPCVNTAQGAAAAAIALHAMLKLGPAALQEIELIMPDYRVIARQQADAARSRPDSRESADHSFQFIVAVAVIDGTFGLAQFENERWRDPAIVAMMEKITVRRGDLSSANTAAPFPCAIRAKDRGHEYEVDPIDPPGTSKHGLDEVAVIAKFHFLTESILLPAQAQRIVDAVMTFDRSPSSEILDAAIAIGEPRR